MREFIFGVGLGNVFGHVTRETILLSHQNVMTCQRTFHIVRIHGDCILKSHVDWGAMASVFAAAKLHLPTDYDPELLQIARYVPRRGFRTMSRVGGICFRTPSPLAHHSFSANTDMPRVTSLDRMRDLMEGDISKHVHWYPQEFVVQCEFTSSCGTIVARYGEESDP